MRPNSVSTGCTDRQLDFTPQSPQPSHTRSLMTMPLGWLREHAALAVTALLRGALLVVDQHRHALDPAQLLLRLDDAVRSADLDIGDAAVARPCSALGRRW